MWNEIIESSARLIRLDLKHSQRRYFEVLQTQIRPGIRWLDVGCGHQIVPPWAASDAEQGGLISSIGLFAGVDLDPAIREHPFLKYRAFARGEALPFASGSFDIVTSNMVVEHLDDPKSTFLEIRRVMRGGGKFIFHTPNLRYPYILLASKINDALKKRLIRVLEKRDEKDVFPTYYRANNVELVCTLADKTDFQVEDVKVVGSVGSFNQLGPLGVLELPFLKLLSAKPFRGRNATIIAILTKPEQDKPLVQSAAEIDAIHAHTAPLNRV